MFFSVLFCRKMRNLGEFLAPELLCKRNRYTSDFILEFLTRRERYTSDFTPEFLSRPGDFTSEFLSKKDTPVISPQTSFPGKIHQWFHHEFLFKRERYANDITQEFLSRGERYTWFHLRISVHERKKYLWFHHRIFLPGKADIPVLSS